MNPFAIIRVIASVMLMVCLFGKFPLGYYTLLRWGVFLTCGYGAFKFSESKWIWFFGLTALVFNPIIPFIMEREWWLVFDVLAALGLALSIFFAKVKEEPKKN